MLQSILAKFAEHRQVWQAAVDCASELDALLSLAVAASSSAGPMCRPVILPDNAQGAAGRSVPARLPSPGSCVCVYVGGWVGGWERGN